MQESLAFTPQVTARGVAQWLWLIPAVPMLAAGVIALLKQPARKLASALAIGSLGFSLLLALLAFGHVLSGWSHGYAVREAGELQLDPGGRQLAWNWAGCSIRSRR